MDINPSALANLARKQKGKRLRISSWDRTGGNDDRIHIPSGKKAIIAQMDQPGEIEHIWATICSDGLPTIEKNGLRKVILRIYWDDEKEPSVEVPLGDFFGIGHAKSKNYSCAVLSEGPQNGLGMNSWWVMPYQKARLEILNECQCPLIFYYYVDYREFPEGLDSDVLRFHSQWRRVCPCSGVPLSQFQKREDWLFGETNLDGKDNYVLLEAKGEGHYCGCHLDIDNFNDDPAWDWPGEGDDMIFIDGAKLPTLNGTGTEDYFGMAWCPTQEYTGLYNGLLYGTDPNWKGQITYYRYHILDPINFEKDIKVTIEHGHANHRSDDDSSTVYWYQKEPHLPFPKMLPVEERMPIDHKKTSEKGKIIKEDPKEIK